MLGRSLIPVGVAVATLVTTAQAQEISISDDMASATATVYGEQITIVRRGEDQPACPSDCIQPMQAATGISTLGELELIAFLTDVAGAGRGLLIDTRLPDAFAQGSIPGAVNVPAPTLDAANPFRADILKALGAEQSGSAGQWSYAGAQQLVLFCDGPSCASAVASLRSLAAAGYPPERLGYYRGGLASWRNLGLNTK